MNVDLIEPHLDPSDQGSEDGTLAWHWQLGPVPADVCSLAGMARRHAVAVAIKHHAGEEAGLARSSAALAPGSIAGELLLNGIPQWLIDDRRVFARMELALVNDLAEIGAVLQHQVECAAREQLAADEAPGSARPRLTFDPARFELRL